MAVIFRSSLGDSFEVPEPDLSMELQDQLKRCLTEHESGMFKEESAYRRHDLSIVRARLEANMIRHRCAEASVMEMVMILKSFDPEISWEKLSNDIYSIIHSDAVVEHLNLPLKNGMRAFVPSNRTMWFSADVENHIRAKRLYMWLIHQWLWEILRKGVTLFPEATADIDIDEALAAALTPAGGGAVVLSAICGAAGMVAGSITGLIVGAVPAPLTFGLSLPIGATVGGGLGSFGGAAAGATVGFCGGAATGVAVYIHREDSGCSLPPLRDAVLSTISNTRTRAQETIAYLKVSAIDSFDGSCAQVVDIASRVAETASTVKQASKQKAIQIGSSLPGLPQDHSSHAILAAATGGAIAVGASAGSAGAVAGGTLGAAFGTVPALFTFGMSIPLGAAVGSSIGLCAGVVTGGTVGFWGGGGAGAGCIALSKQQHIGACISCARETANSVAGVVRDRANLSASFVRTRIAGDCGGTDLTRGE